jgi:hypothetical protein
LVGWLAAREETHAHVKSGALPVDEDWMQRLADLLATERSWQEQYTSLLGLGRTDGKFPPSQR